MSGRETFCIEARNCIAANHALNDSCFFCTNSSLSLLVAIRTSFRFLRDVLQVCDPRECDYTQASQQVRRPSLHSSRQHSRTHESEGRPTQHQQLCDAEDV